MIARVVVLGRGWLGTAVADRLRLPDDCRLDLRALIGGAESAVPLRDRLAPTRGLAVVNAIGRTTGSRDALRSANVAVPAVVVSALQGSGALLVHLGSAAEYGDPGGPDPITEQAALRPGSEYAQTKAAGTEVALSYERSCVLRPFNIVGASMPAQQPIAEIRAKVRRAMTGNGVVPLWAAATTRDFVSLDFVTASVARASEGDLLGAYNVCSGVGIQFGALVGEMGRQAGRELRVVDECRPGVPTVVGAPEKWEEATGMREPADTASVAKMVWEAGGE